MHNSTSLTDATNQRTKKPATNDNTIADIPTFVEVAPLLVEVAVATIVLLPTTIVAPVLPPTIVTLGAAIEAPVLPATIVTLPAAIEAPVLPATIVTLPAMIVVGPPSSLVSVVEEAAAALEPEPELTAVDPESSADEGIERILVVVGAEVGVRVVLPID